MSAPVTMPEDLRAEMRRLGWSDDRIDRMTWGRRVRGSPEGMTLECPYRPGHEFYVSGPATSVRAGDFVAIVRYG